MPTSTEQAKRIMSEPLSSYTLREILLLIAGNIEKAPFSFAQEMKDAAEVGLDQLIKSTGRALERIGEFEMKIDRQREVSINALEGYYKAVRNKRDEVSKKISELPQLADIKIPYNFADLIKTAQQFQYLDDKTWGRVIELARAFASKGDSQ